MIVTLPWPNRDLSPNVKKGWRAKWRATKAAKLSAWVRVKSDSLHRSFAGADVLHVKITFHPPDRRARDEDNLVASCKAYLDGIAGAILVDDSRFRLSHTVGDVCKGGAVIVTVTL